MPTSGGHAAAGVRAAAAELGAVAHLDIVAEPLARFSAAVADLGAQAAGGPMKLGAAQHVVGARSANLGTVEEQSDVIGLGVGGALRGRHAGL